MVFPPASLNFQIFPLSHLHQKLLMPNSSWGEWRTGLFSFSCRGELGKQLSPFGGTGPDKGPGRSLWSRQCLFFEWRPLEPSEEARLKGRFFDLLFSWLWWLKFQNHISCIHALSFKLCLYFNCSLRPHKVKFLFSWTWNTNQFWCVSSDEWYHLHVSKVIFHTHTRDYVSRYTLLCFAFFPWVLGIFLYSCLVHQHFGFIDRLLVETF